MGLRAHRERDHVARVQLHKFVNNSSEGLQDVERSKASVEQPQHRGERRAYVTALHGNEGATKDDARWDVRDLRQTWVCTRPLEHSAAYGMDRVTRERAARRVHRLGDVQSTPHVALRSI